MEVLHIKKESDFPTIGKLLNSVLTITVDSEKKYEVKSDEQIITIGEGVHTLEFSASISSLFIKLPMNIKKVEKVLEISNDQKINVVISKDNISVDVKESIGATNGDPVTIEKNASPATSSPSTSNESESVSMAKAQGRARNALYYCVGDEGRTLTVYEDKATVKTKPSILANYSGNGEKTIYYADCVGIQYKASTSGMLRGFLQLETSSMQKNENNYYSENSFVWNIGKKSDVTNELMEEIRDFIQKRIRDSKNPQPVTVMQSVSPAEELKKFKDLLDAGIITQEEFEAKKKQLLGI